MIEDEPRHPRTWRPEIVSNNMYRIALKVVLYSTRHKIVCRLEPNMQPSQMAGCCQLFSGGCWYIILACVSAFPDQYHELLLCQEHTRTHSTLQSVFLIFPVDEWFYASSHTDLGFFSRPGLTDNEGDKKY